MSGRPLILYHANCADGHTAAWVAHRRFGEAADYLPVQYGQPPPDCRGRNVFILDFSYKLPVMREIVLAARSVVVLDHHKTAQEDLSALDNEPLVHGGMTVPHHIVFDMNKSGARLAWEYFFPDEPVPWLVAYTEARDLWTFHLPFSKEISAAIASYPMTFPVWDALDKALSNDPIDLRNMRGRVPETAADFARRKTKEVLLSHLPLQNDAGRKAPELS